MEETRQHSALTTEQRAFVVIYAGGLLALLAGIVALFIDPRIFWAGAMAWAASKIVTAAWPLLRSEVALGEPAAKWRLVLNLVGWSAILLGLYFYGGLK